jgi:hypothetical protein
MSDNPPWLSPILNKFTSAISLGSGLLGKSAIVVGPAVVLIVGVAFSMHSDLMKLGTILIAVVALFLWYFPFLRFCEKHPADALLEGAHWAQHQQLILAIKGKPAIAIDAPQNAELTLMTTNPRSDVVKEKA